MKMIFAPFALALLIPTLALAQNPDQDDPIVTLDVSQADIGAQASPESLSYRAMGVAGSNREGPSSASRREASGPPALDPYAGEFYPVDVSNPQDGQAMWTAQQHPIYLNMPPSHWGNPGQFLKDLGNSDFVHILDQYVYNSANNRYTLGTSFGISGYPIPANHTLGIKDILAVTHAAAAIGGTGLDHLYHVFLPQGVNMCITAAECYSPDNNATFVFCAFHASVTFSDDVNHVVFTVEPYQNVNGCSVPPTGTASGQLNDSTATVLSHEVFESISDPDGDAWWVHDFTFANGNEIADVCTRAGQFGKNFYWNYGNVQLDQHMYTIQPEYSNRVHGCTYRPRR